MRRTARVPADFSNFAPRQREILSVIYNLGGATAREIHKAIPDPPPSVCGIRTLLNRMIRKGHVKTRRSGRHNEIVYLIARSTDDVQLKAFRRVADEYFGGSKKRALATLLQIAGAEAARAHGQEDARTG